MSILPDSGRGDVFALPDRMPGKPRHVRHSCTVFGGLAGAGEVGADTLQAMANLVPCGYPALTTGNARLQYLAAPMTGAAHGLTLHRGKVVLAQGTGLFVSSGAGACTRLGNVTDTDKRFAFCRTGWCTTPPTAVCANSVWTPAIWRMSPLTTCT